MSDTTATKKTLTIERAHWRRGGDSDELVESFGSTHLLNERGYMCCLGFDALANGLSQTRILNQFDPANLVECDELGGFDNYRHSRTVRSVEHDEEDDYDYSVYRLSDAAAKAVEHNDDPTLTDDQRERLIREDLIALGWDDVVFV